MQVCDHVHLYGFDSAVFESAGASLNHYYDNRKARLAAHNFPRERELLNRAQARGLISIHWRFYFSFYLFIFLKKRLVWTYDIFRTTLQFAIEFPQSSEWKFKLSVNFIHFLLNGKRNDCWFHNCDWSHDAQQLWIEVDFQFRSIDAAIGDWRCSWRYSESACHRQSQRVVESVFDSLLHSRLVHARCQQQVAHFFRRLLLAVAVVVIIVVVLVLRRPTTTTTTTRSTRPSNHSPQSAADNCMLLLSSSTLLFDVVALVAVADWIASFLSDDELMTQLCRRNSRTASRFWMKTFFARVDLRFRVKPALKNWMFLFFASVFLSTVYSEDNCK